MDSLYKYVGKNVIVTFVDGMTAKGEIDDFESIHDSEDGQEWIGMWSEKYLSPMTFSQSEIKSIEIID